MTGLDLERWRHGRGLTIEAAARLLALPLAKWLRWEQRPTKPIPRRIVESIRRHDDIDAYLRQPPSTAPNLGHDIPPRG